MNVFRADLHCHSTCSDGSLSPVELVALAKKSGLSGLSITDHDSVEAYASATDAAAKNGVELISGVEFTTSHHGMTVHVLAYGFNVDHPAIKDLCSHHLERRRMRAREILEKLSDHGMPIEEDFFVTHDGLIGRPHIAAAMVEKGYVETTDQAFRQFLGDGKICYVQGKDAVSTDETLKIIHQANAFAVIAHPHLVKNRYVILDLLKMDFDGIEGYYAKFFPNKEEQWVKIGQEKGWLITGGSDFHGVAKPKIPLGASWVGLEVFEVLKSRYRENSNE